MQNLITIKYIDYMSVISGVYPLKHFNSRKSFLLSLFCLVSLSPSLFITYIQLKSELTAVNNPSIQALFFGIFRSITIFLNIFVTRLSHLMFRRSKTQGFTPIDKLFAVNRKLEKLYGTKTKISYFSVYFVIVEGLLIISSILLVEFNRFIVLIFLVFLAKYVKLIQWINLLHIIRVNTRSINSMLSNLGKQPVLNDPTSNLKVYHSLVCIFRELQACSQELSQIFNPDIISLVVILFLSSLDIPIKILYNNPTSWTLHIVIYCCNWNLFYLLTVFCSLAAKESQNLSRTIDSTLTHQDCSEISLQLQVYLSELKDRQLTFSTYGMFKVDNSLLPSQ
ncbi:uncharacterized protein LOC111058725 isoform X2 [Nilaparvata lugens]|uniref:uncharacterized protein LOC111058725 isoform X2 n=1 Tax=Nilaparvata lugens TaxID=108931 RepID=UPI00193D53D3|nr:uncharacterized protein LOC111058725 isoform X2 [Nilaparvata lugens]